MRGGIVIDKFDIYANLFLHRRTTGYFHQYYTGYRQPNNPDFLNNLKNTFNNERYNVLIDARNTVVNILMEDIPAIIEETNILNWACVCVPRAKELGTYADSQLMFKEAVSIAANNIQGLIDGTQYITRVIDTFTTHLGNATRDGRIDIINEGDRPYPSITLDTCIIDNINIINRNIILIDDIYTRNVNIDEDCIQALFDNEANNVIFYSIGYTRWY